MEFLSDDVICVILLHLDIAKTLWLILVSKSWKERLYKSIIKNKYLQFKNRICAEAKEDWFSWEKLPLCIFEHRAIIKAATKGDEELAKFILKCNIENTLYSEALIKAIKEKHVKVVRILLTHSETKPSANNNCAILLAAGEGNVEIVKMLLEHPEVDPTANNYRALYIALNKKHSEVVKLILSDNRIDPFYNNKQFISEAYHEYLKTGNNAKLNMLMQNDRVENYIQQNIRKSTKNCIIL